MLGMGAQGPEDTGKKGREGLSTSELPNGAYAREFHKHRPPSFVNTPQGVFMELSDQGKHPLRDGGSTA